jgi:PKD repeat protein
MILGNFSQGIAYFETDPIAGKAVQFKNLSFGNNLKSFWNFGDGITSTQTNPLHNYKNAGIYQVQLTTIDELNNVSNYETSIIVASAEALFNSKFQAYPDLESDTVVFINKTTTNGNGKYLWSFGDGYVSEEYSPEHVYSQKGNYNVCLSVFDNSKSADIKCQTINVGSNSTVVSSFNAIVENLKVSFVNTTHGENSYYWNFGDSITSTGINPIHQYSTAGIYTVVLKANNGSLNNSAVSVINLSNNPEQLVCRFVNEKVSNTLKATGTQVKFKGVISGDISRLRINWNFGDGETDSTTTEPTHTYSEPDLYTVCYTVTNPDNDETYQYCEDLNLKSEVNLTHNQISLFDFAPNPAKNKLSVNITNNNLPSTISISTLFGQIVKQLNISANSILPINCDLSLSPGFYIVKLQQGNNSNCKKLVVK